MSNQNYQICTRCIMDTSDPEITFDKEGVCNHCNKAFEIKGRVWLPNDKGKTILDNIVKKIKEEGDKNEYDCIIGLSGGIDSSYLACKVKDYGLNPLAVHVDAGWNSELAVSNIENIVKKLKIDLYTHVVDWEEMKDLQLAFLKAGVANQDTPQDHAIFSVVYKVAVKHNIKYVVSGANFATESILPGSWGYNAMDSKHIKAIHKLFGKKKLKSYPMVSFFEQHFKFPYVNRIKIISPLNYIPYNRDEAMKYLKENYGWRDYGGKHHESKFTKYFQAYYLPKVFGYDKRRAHLSSLIVSEQISRAVAIKELKNSPCDDVHLKEEQDYIIRKLSLTHDEFIKLINSSKHFYYEYPNSERSLLMKNKFFGFLSAIKHMRDK